MPAIVDAAHAKGMAIALNPSPYDAKLEAVDFSNLSWLLVNEVEAGQIEFSMRMQRNGGQVSGVMRAASRLMGLRKEEFEGSASQQ